jgi:hypothetical protein
LEGQAVNFANYNAFRTAFMRLIMGDHDEESVSIDTADLLIQLGEVRVYRDLRCSSMEASFAGVTVTNNLAPIPADLIETSLVQFTGEYPAEYVSEQKLIELNTDKASGSRIHYYTQQGDNLTFWPAVANATTVSGRYYKKFPDIKTGLNAVFTRYPEIFMFAGLAEAAPFIGEDDRIPVWESKFRELVASANKIERMRSSSGSSLRMRIR